MSAAIETEKLGWSRGIRYVDPGRTATVLSLPGIVGFTLVVLLAMLAFGRGGIYTGRKEQEQ